MEPFIEHDPVRKPVPAADRVRGGFFGSCCKIHRAAREFNVFSAPVGALLRC